MKKLLFTVVALGIEGSANKIGVGIVRYLRNSETEEVDAAKHFEGGAKKVIISAPSAKKNSEIIMYILIPYVVIPSLLSISSSISLSLSSCRSFISISFKSSF